MSRFWIITVCPAANQPQNVLQRAALLATIKNEKDNKKTFSQYLCLLSKYFQGMLCKGNISTTNWLLFSTKLLPRLIQHFFESFPFESVGQCYKSFYTLRQIHKCVLKQQNNACRKFVLLLML